MASKPVRLVTTVRSVISGLRMPTLNLALLGITVQKAQLPKTYARQGLTPTQQVYGILLSV